MWLETWKLDYPVFSYKWILRACLVPLMEEQFSFIGKGHPFHLAHNFRRDTPGVVRKDGDTRPARSVMSTLAINEITDVTAKLSSYLIPSPFWMRLSTVVILTLSHHCVLSVGRSRVTTFLVHRSQDQEKLNLKVLTHIQTWFRAWIHKFHPWCHGLVRLWES